MSDQSGGDISLNTRMTRRQAVKGAALLGAGAALTIACNLFENTANTVNRAVATVTSPQADKNRKDNINRASKNVTGSTLGENVRSAKDQAGGFLKDRVNEAEEAAQNAIDAAEKGAKTIGTGAEAPVQLVNPRTLNPSSR